MAFNGVAIDSGYLLLGAIMPSKNIKFFQDLIRETCDLLEVPSPVLLPDNKMTRYLGYTYFNKKYDSWVIKYSVKNINDLPDALIAQTAFHELGHALTYSKDATQREYLAERFAISLIKKYFPKFYIPAMMDCLQYICGKQGIYAKAFKKILKEENFPYNI